MKTWVQGLLRYWGRELRSVDAPTRSFARGLELLHPVVAPRTVIDIGVAHGTPELYQQFPPNAFQYLLVEANPVFREDLAGLKSQLNAVVVNAFCGATAGQVRLRQYEDPRKSSAYAVTRGLNLTAEIDVPVLTLDTIVSEHGLPGPFLMKIDVEGAELDVLRGATQTLTHTEAIIAEVAVLPKYHGGADLPTLVGYLDERGFAVFDILAGTNHSRTKYLHQVDLLFTKKDAPFRTSAL